MSYSPTVLQVLRKVAVFVESENMQNHNRKEFNTLYEWCVHNDKLFVTCIFRVKKLKNPRRQDVSHHYWRRTQSDF